MNPAFRLLSLLMVLVPATGTEAPVSLVPERELGSRHPGHLQFGKIQWSADSPWFHKPAPVCKVVGRPMDLRLLRKEAERTGMVPELLRPDSDLGLKEEGVFSYVTEQSPRMAAGGNPLRRFLFFGVTKFDDFERDEHQMAVVKPLATREESVAICREWMKKLGIDENNFYREGEWPGGFEVNAMTGRVSRIHPVTKENVVALFGQQLRFIQQIGGLPAFWSGFGGNIMFKIGDGGEFCGLLGCLRAWEKIGDYEVLDRTEVEAALADGFAWVHDPIDCERLEVVKVELTAYHSDFEVPQADFPLVYGLRCKLHGGRDDGQEKEITLPALKQHRDKYGPRPELTEEEKLFNKMLAAEGAGRRVKPLTEMTPEELKALTPEQREEIARAVVAAGGMVIPPLGEGSTPSTPEPDKARE